LPDDTRHTITACRARERARARERERERGRVPDLARGRVDHPHAPGVRADGQHAPVQSGCEPRLRSRSQRSGYEPRLRSRSQRVEWLCTPTGEGFGKEEHRSTHPPEQPRRFLFEGALGVKDPHARPAILKKKQRGGMEVKVRALLGGAAVREGAFRSMLFFCVGANTFILFARFSNLTQAKAWHLSHVALGGFIDYTTSMITEP